MVFLKEFFEKVDFEKKNQQTIKKREKLPSMQRVNLELNGLIHPKTPSVPSRLSALMSLITPQRPESMLMSCWKCFHEQEQRH